MVCPRLIVDGRASHLGDFTIQVFLILPGLLAGQGVPICKQSKLTGAAPKAKKSLSMFLWLKCLGSGLLWPVAALQEFLSGDLVAKDEESPFPYASFVNHLLFFGD